jgi:hypothetical protein
VLPNLKLANSARYSKKKCLHADVLACFLDAVDGINARYLSGES